MASAPGLPKRIWQTLSSIKTGVILLILVVILSAAGTVILQRPATDPDDLQRAYSPQMLRVLDLLGLTDVFHAWWFVLLLLLVSASIVAASIDRFPNAWRFFSRPYKSTDESFRKALPVQAKFAIASEAEGLAIAERVLRAAGFKPERVVRDNHAAWFGERNRISEMSVYIVHASLLLIFLGGIVDALYGWRGFLALTRGEQSAKIEARNGTARVLPFEVRCDAAGQENYADGSPKRWWSKLAVVQDGREVLRKEIAVNDPLVYRGVRFYQASYGDTGKLDKLILTATPKSGNGSARDIALAVGDSVQLDANTSVKLAQFIPDYVVRDGDIYTRSNEVDNPAAHLIVQSAQAKPVNVWIPAIPEFEQNADSPYQFDAKDLKMAYFTGLQVSHEPGQWAVWAGVILMGFGLTCVFYLVHQRVWAVPVQDARGQWTLWVGGAANKNRDVFEQRFRKMTEAIRAELAQGPKAGTPERERETSMAGA